MGEKSITAYKEWQRVEKKYLFSTPIAYTLRRRLQAVLQEDAHNGPDGYRVRSLYFDTISDADFFDKLDGLEQRRKVRLRIYPPDYGAVKLEVKEKSGAYQRKRTLTVSPEDARALIRRDFDVLLRMEHPLASELFGILYAEVYLPRCIVEYKRQAFLAPGGDVRLTFDSLISAREGCSELFAPALNLYPVLDSSDITLEVKYSHFLFGYIRDTLGEYGKIERSVSKYCLSRHISYIQS
ncbi:MAG: polyphosphate polymerase domain-containing protein [Clostridiales Family XIII bacterium]|nr:polyphosphate polymerase domain-containing protein [Clostridiales Family XIII bacterium]